MNKKQKITNKKLLRFVQEISQHRKHYRNKIIRKKIPPQLNLPPPLPNYLIQIFYSTYTCIFILHNKTTVCLIIKLSIHVFLIFLCFHYFFLVFLSLIFSNRHASIKKPVKIVDYCDLPLQNVYRYI